MKGRKPKIIQFDPSARLKGEVAAVDKNEINENLVLELLPPDFLETEKTIWMEIASIINDAGYLSKRTSFKIKMIVPQIDFYNQCVKKIRKDEVDWESTGGRNGLQKKAHHLFPTMNSLGKEINSFIASFGLDPVAEKRLKDVRQGDLFGGGEFGDNGV